MDQILSPYNVSVDQLKILRDDYQKEFDLGLARGPPEAAVAMLPSFLPELPDGTESGRYLGLDLGGTNLRVLILTVTPGTPLDLRSTNYEVSQAAMTGPGSQLFDFIVEKLVDFLTKEDLLEEQLSLGFVFSFPCDQKGLRQAVLLWWTKGYTCSDSIGHDSVAMLQEAIDRRGNLKVKVQAIMNDTVGCLVASAYEHGRDCLIGGVVSTGCNVSYVEQIEAIPKFDAKAANYRFPTMIVDTEWEEQGNQGFFSAIETDVDQIIDRESTHRGRQTQDKYIAGLYLGEHVRHLLLKAAAENLAEIATSGLADAIKEKDSFPPKYVSFVLGCDNLDGSKRVLAELGVQDGPDATCKVVKEICDIVSKRSAGVLAVALSALVVHTGVRQLKIGLAGSLYENHPTYRTLLLDWMKLLVPTDVQFTIVFTEDGSGKGAALVAAIAEKLKI